VLGNPNADIATTTELALAGTTVPQGEGLTATVTVRAADGYEVGGRVRVSAPGWEETVYLDRGVAAVTVPAGPSTGTRAITAEYLGHDVLSASQAAGSVFVVPRVSAPVGGHVPATLSLELGAPVSLGTFVPGVPQERTGSTTATVTSTAGEAVLSVASATLANGPFTLARPLVVTPERTRWDAPVSNDTFAVAFKQVIAASDPLRTGEYRANVTFTLSTTTP